VVTWRRIREGMVCARPRRNSGILSLEEERKFYFFRSGYVTNWYQSMVTTLGLLGLMHESHKEVLLSALLLKEKDCRM
jgi:hypothetical protein